MLILRPESSRASACFPASAKTHLVTNMNLPLLIQLLFVPESTPIDEAIRQIVEADDTKVKYVNDLLGQAELDEF